MPAKYRYTLDNATQGALVLDQDNEPLNWENLTLIFKRSKEFHGVTKSFSQDLIFWGAANDYLRIAYDTSGINSNVTALIEIYSYDSYAYETLFEGRVNFSNYSEEITTEGLSVVNTNLESTLFEAQVEKGADVEVDVFKLEDRFQTPITPFPNYEVVKPSLTGQVITDSFTSATNPNPRNDFFNIEDFAGINREKFFGQFSMTDDTESKLNLKIPQTFIGRATPLRIWEVANRGNTTISFNLDFDLKLRLRTGFFLNPSSSNDLTVTLKIVSAISNTVLELVETRNDLGSSVEIDTNFTFNDSITQVFEQGDEISFYLEIDTIVGVEDGFWTMDQFYISSNTFEFEIFQASEFQKTLPRGMFPLELFTRVVQFLTGEPDRVVGEAISRVNQNYNPLGVTVDGIASKVLTCTGKGLRNFPADQSQLTVTLQNLFDSFKYGFNLGLGFIDVSGTESVIVEDISFFYNDTVIMTITEGIEAPIMKLESSDIFSTLLFGFSKYKIEDRDFQTSQEFNTQRSYNSAVQIERNNLNLLSPYIGAGYGLEYQRRQQFFENATANKPDGKRFDDDKFLLSCTEETGGSKTSTGQINQSGVTRAFISQTVEGGDVTNQVAYFQNFIETENSILYNNGTAGYVQTTGVFTRDYENSTGVSLEMGGQINTPGDEAAYDVSITLTGTFIASLGSANIARVTVSIFIEGVASPIREAVYNNPTGSTVMAVNESIAVTIDPSNALPRTKVVFTILDEPSSVGTYRIDLFTPFLFRVNTDAQFQEYRQENAADYFGSGVTVTNLLNSDSALNFRISPRQAIERHRTILAAVNHRLAPDQLSFSGDPVGNVLVEASSPTFANGQVFSERDNISTTNRAFVENETLTIQIPWTWAESKLVDANRYGSIIISNPDIEFEGYIDELEHRVEDDQATLTLRRKGVAPPVTPPVLLQIRQSPGSESTALSVLWSYDEISTGFRLEIDTVPPTGWTTVVTVGPTFRIAGASSLTPSTTYSMRVIALSGSAESEPSNVLSLATAANVVVDAPTLDTAVQTPGSEANSTTMTWTSNSGGTEDGFRIERKSTTGIYVTAGTVGAGILTFVDSPLLSGITWTYRIFAFVGPTDSDPSNELSVSTDAIPPVPDFLLASAFINGVNPFIVLTWSEGGQPDTIEVQRSEVSGVGPWDSISLVEGGELTFTDIPLTPATTFYYRIRSIYQPSSFSDFTPVVSATTSTP